MADNVTQQQEKQDSAEVLAKWESVCDEERASWSARIADLMPMLSKPDKLLDLQVLSLSYRGQVVDVMAGWRGRLRRITQRADNAKADRTTWHITHSQLKIRNNEMLETFVRKDLADLLSLQQLVKDQLTWFGEQLSTLNSLQFAIRMAKEIYTERAENF